MNIEMTGPAESLTSPLLAGAGFRHGFFTRHGGVSTGAYASLNFSVTAGDTAANVHENLARAAQALGASSERLHFLSQVHGRAVVQVDAASLSERSRVLEGDALATIARDVACAVRTADCVPVLLADKRSGAVAAAHAGWRGAVQGIVSATVSVLRELAGDRAEILAAIGPHISLAAFEVSPEVAAEILAASLDPRIVDRSRPKPHVDLRRMLHAELRHAGVQQIDDVHGCTLSEPERFFSYRLGGKASGRHLSAIVARL